jgi:hypothetical protein
MHAAQFKVYLMIECFVWLPAAYIFCYRFQPTVRFAKTDSGKRIVIAASNFLERRAPSTHASLAKLANQAQGAPAGRAAAEWALLNKVGEISTRATCRALVEARPCLLIIVCMPSGAGSNWVPDEDVDCSSGREKLGCESGGGAAGRAVMQSLVAFVAGQACCEVPLPKLSTSLSETSSRFSRCRHRSPRLTTRRSLGGPPASASLCGRSTPSSLAVLKLFCVQY